MSEEKSSQEHALSPDRGAIATLSLLESNCPMCNVEQVYKTLQGLAKGLEKPYRSCANSIAKGGFRRRKVVDGQKECCTCKKSKPTEDFYFFDERSATNCKSCSHLKSQDYHHNHYRFAKYDLTSEECKNLLAEQNHQCATCERKFKHNKYHIDHCRKTNIVRGLLCSLCNKGPGQFKDNVETLQNTITYLNNNNEKRI